MSYACMNRTFPKIKSLQQEQMQGIVNPPPLILDLKRSQNPIETWQYPMSKEYQVSITLVFLPAKESVYLKACQMNLLLMRWIQLAQSVKIRAVGFTLLVTLELIPTLKPLKQEIENSNSVNVGSTSKLFILEFGGLYRAGTWDIGSRYNSFVQKAKPSVTLDFLASGRYWQLN